MWRTSDKSRNLFPILTAVTAVLCVILFLGVNVAIANRGNIEMWGYPDDYAIFQGRYITLVTSAFVHQEPLHLLFNLYWLWILGGALERAIGKLGWLMFVIASAFVSSGLQLATGESGIGLSGVGYALFGFGWAAKDVYPEFDRIVSQSTVRTFLLWGIFCVVMTALHLMQIANAAHLGGLLFGGALGIMMSKPKFTVPMCAAMTALLAVAVGALFWNPLSPDWNAIHAYQASKKGQLGAAAGYFRAYLDRGGADPRWGLTNLAAVYAREGDRPKFDATIQELDKVDSKVAKEMATAFDAFQNADKL